MKRRSRRRKSKWLKKILIYILYIMEYMVEKKYVHQDMNIVLTSYLDDKQIFGSRARILVGSSVIMIQ